MRETVVCCTDGSSVSWAAIEAGLALLDRDRWTTEVVTVVPEVILDPGMPGPMPAVSYTSALAPQDLVASRRRALESGDIVVAEAVRRLGLAPGSGRVLVGSPGPALVEHCAQIGAHLVVAGTRGLGGAARLVLGSVCDHLVRHAPCPVVVSGEEVSPPASGPVVVCVDDSQRSVRAGALAVHLLAADLPIALATVIGLPRNVGEGGFEELVDRRRGAEADRLLVAAATGLGIPDIEFLALSGADPADALIELAREVPVRLLVIGSHGHPGVVRAVLGSTAERVLRRAPCPVCVVPGAVVPRGD